MYTIPEISTIVKNCNDLEELIKALKLIKNYCSYGLMFEKIVSVIAENRASEL